MRLRLDVSPMLRNALRVKVQLPRGAGWDTRGTLHLSRAEFVGFFALLRRGADGPEDVQVTGPPTLDHERW